MAAFLIDFKIDAVELEVKVSEVKVVEEVKFLIEITKNTRDGVIVIVDEKVSSEIIKEPIGNAIIGIIIVEV